MKPLRCRRGFTLIEVIIACILFAILAMMMIPRLTNLAHREEEIVLDRLSEALTLFAHRESLGVQPVGLWRDPETGLVCLLVKDVDPASPEDKPEWRPDRLLEPVELPAAVIIEEVIVDGQSMSGEQEWLISSVPAGGRPSVQLHVVSPTIDVLLSLDEHSLQPRRLDLNKDFEDSVVRETVNLDSAGRERERW